MGYEDEHDSMGYEDEHDKEFVTFTSWADGVLPICEDECLLSMMSVEHCYEDWPMKMCMEEACSSKLHWMEEHCDGKFAEIEDGEMKDLGDWAEETINAANCEGCEVAFPMMGRLCGENAVAGGACVEDSECSRAIGMVKDTCREDDEIWVQEWMEMVSPHQALKEWLPEKACDYYDRYFGEDSELPPMCTPGKMVKIPWEMAVRIRAQRCTWTED
mmetsp:Transcript_2383/g.6004  ORF Transcript_2383/g.6004 Transcript_2383/m.6004 type:complete len:216 (-) Transcript_2383:24-671(-)